MRRTVHLGIAKLDDFWSRKESKLPWPSCTGQTTSFLLLRLHKRYLIKLAHLTEVSHTKSSSGDSNFIFFPSLVRLVLSSRQQISLNLCLWNKRPSGIRNLLFSNIFIDTTQVNSDMKQDYVYLERHIFQETMLTGIFHYQRTIPFTTASHNGLI